MRVLLVDIDSKISNLALMKISSYYKNKGDIVGFNVDNPDIIYISCIFTKNIDRVKLLIDEQIKLNPNVYIDVGGSGWSVTKKLPESIDALFPDYSLYPDNKYSIGFTTRGCIRNCSFCIVNKKEGNFKIYSDITNFYNPNYNKLILLDNNIFACKDNFVKVYRFCRTHRLKIDITQGLDIRLLDIEYALMLKKLHPMSNWKFAFDSIHYKNKFIEGIKLLTQVGISRKKLLFYVYADDSENEYCFESALERCSMIREMGIKAFIMLNCSNKQPRRMHVLKKWCNTRVNYEKYTFEEYIRKNIK